MKYEPCSDAFCTEDILCETWSEPYGVSQLLQYRPLNKRMWADWEVLPTECETNGGMPYAIRSGRCTMYSRRRMKQGSQVRNPSHGIYAQRLPRGER